MVATFGAGLGRCELGENSGAMSLSVSGLPGSGTSFLLKHISRELASSGVEVVALDLESGMRRYPKVARSVGGSFVKCPHRPQSGPGRASRALSGLRSRLPVGLGRYCRALEVPESSPYLVLAAGGFAWGWDTDYLGRCFYETLSRLAEDRLLDEYRPTALVIDEAETARMLGPAVGELLEEILARSAVNSNVFMAAADPEAARGGQRADDARGSVARLMRDCQVRAVMRQPRCYSEAVAENMLGAQVMEDETRRRLGRISSLLDPGEGFAADDEGRLAEFRGVRARKAGGGLVRFCLEVGEEDEMVYTLDTHRLAELEDKYGRGLMQPVAQSR